MIPIFLTLLSCRSTGEVHPEPVVMSVPETTEESAPPPMPAPPRRVAPPCNNLAAALIPALSGDTTGLDVSEAGVQVTVEAGEDATLPAGFAEELRAGGLIQGRMPAADLCTLATTPGVTAVRSPITASPKQD
ncbi:MAG: hypothetical protein ACI8RZ_006316 [Myxococcota bacterium]|jgi:hypothetical protein